MDVGEIFLNAIPNQTFQLIIGQNNFQLTIKTLRENTYMSITINEQKISENIRCFSNDIVYPYNYDIPTVFCWLCQDMKDPYYTKFGTLHKLLYISE